MIDYIEYNDSFRDDMLFCYLLAKDTLGGIPRLKEDLLDIKGEYYGRGDRFWLALEGGRVVGMLGVHTASAADVWLKRLFIKPGFKRRGIGTALLGIAEDFAVLRGAKTLHTRFSDDYLEAAQFYLARGFLVCGRSDGLCRMTKLLERN